MQPALPPSTTVVAPLQHASRVRLQLHACPPLQAARVRLHPQHRGVVVHVHVEVHHSPHYHHLTWRYHDDVTITIITLIIIISPQSITLIFSLATVSSDTSSPVSTRTFWLTNCSVTGSKTFPRKTVPIFSQCYDWRCGGSVLLFLNKHSLIRSKCELSSSSPILHTSSSAHLHFDK